MLQTREVFGWYADARSEDTSRPDESSLWIRAAVCKLGLVDLRILPQRIDLLVFVPESIWQ